MKIRYVAIAAGILLGTGCSGSGSSGASTTITPSDTAATTESTSSSTAATTNDGSFAPLVDVKAAMAKRGIDCDGTPGPYHPEADELNVGLTPIGTLQCSDIDGSTVTASLWKNTSEADEAIDLMKSVACGFGQKQVQVIEAGVVSIVSDGSTKPGKTALDEIGAVIGAAPKTLTCDKTTTTEPG